ncbi:hypothetical protein N7488_004691 [Penicillium malachiteum]|nr:hypothetical protein N7488_004691 [Penicillium malachiteum]
MIFKTSITAFLMHICLVVAENTQSEPSRSSRLAKRVECLPEKQWQSIQNTHSSASKIAKHQRKTYYTENWAGAALLASDLPSTPTLTSVAATFTVPVPTSSATHVQAASAWVGIDGFMDSGALLQAGIDIVAYKDQPGYFKGWYEWYPGGAIGFDLAIHAGDVLVTTVYSTSDSSGVAILENKSIGENCTVTLTAPSSASTLTGRSVEWIVEDYQNGGKKVDMVDFGTVTFTGMKAGAKDGEAFGVDTAAASVVNMVTGDRVEVEANMVDSSVVVVDYFN